MNIYQKRIIDLSQINVDNNAEIIINEKEVILKQCENAYIEQFNVTIESKGISSIKIDNEIYVSKNGAITFVFDFTKKADKIILCFVNGIADDCALSVNYVKSSKDLWDKKIAKEKRDSLLKTAQIKHSTGTDLVNIYFQPCCDDYVKTVIILYVGTQLMAKYKVDEEVFFKSISGLAYGTYYYELIQYNADGNELLHTEKIQFIISPPNYSGKPVVKI